MLVRGVLLQSTNFLQMLNAADTYNLKYISQIILKGQQLILFSPQKAHF